MLGLKLNNSKPLFNNHAPKVKVKSHTSQGGPRAKEAHRAGAYPGFCSIKQLRALLLLPLDRVLVHRRVSYPRQYVAGTHFIHLGGEKRMWGKVSCLRTQHSGRDWASNHQPSDQKSNALTTTPPRPHNHVPNPAKNFNLLSTI